MIQYIKGTLADMDERTVTIESNGIGFLVHISGPTFDYLPQVGEQIKMYIYFQVKDDGFALFGFLTKDDLRVFELLLGVGGVGPKGALAVLSVLTPDDLRFAVISDDAKAIAKAPGIGTKTAQRVILELKDKLKLADAFHDSPCKKSGSHAGEGRAAGGAAGAHLAWLLRGGGVAGALRH